MGIHRCITKASERSECCQWQWARYKHAIRPGSRIAKRPKGATYYSELLGAGFIEFSSPFSSSPVMRPRLGLATRRSSEFKPWESSILHSQGVGEAGRNILVRCLFILAEFQLDSSSSMIFDWALSTLAESAHFLYASMNGLEHEVSSVLITNLRAKVVVLIDTIEGFSPPKSRH